MRPNLKDPKLTQSIASKKKNWNLQYKEMDNEGIRESFLYKLRYNQIKDAESFTELDGFQAISYSIRDRIVERWIATQQQYTDKNPKRAYYLSLEFLMGRLLGNNISNLGITLESKKAMEDLGLEIIEIDTMETGALSAQWYEEGVRANFSAFKEALK